MKNLLLFMIFAFCLAPAWAGPVTANDLEQLRTAQRELLDTLDRHSATGKISSPELLMEVESMMKHFSRVQDLVTPQSLSQGLAIDTLGTTHQAYLKSYQTRVAEKLGIELDVQQSQIVVRH